MDRDELREQFVDNVSRMTQQWRDVDALVESGKLVPKANRWYEVHDCSVLESVGAICDQIKTSTDSKKPTRIKLMKPDKKLMSVADRHSA